MTNLQESEARSLSVLLDEGRELLQSGKAEKAIELFQQATESHPRNAKVWNDLGVALHANCKPDLAIEAFQMSLLMDPGYADAALNLAVFHHNRGRAIDGFEVLREALRRNPDNSDVKAEMLEQGLIQWKPLALVWNGGDLEVGRYCERTLRSRGFMVAAPESAIVSACSPLVALKPASWIRYFRLVRPRLLVIPPGARCDQDALAAARREGVPFHMMADYLPEKGWDAKPEEIEAALHVILQEIPNAADRINPPTPIVSVVVTVTRNDQDVGGLLDRLAIQDLEPGLFEVLVVDDGVRRPIHTKLDPSHFPYPCRFYRQDQKGLFQARDRANEDAQGRWVFYFSQAERPGPRCLRRMLREHVEDNKISADSSPSGPARNGEAAPAGRFWQYQIREAIREEVGKLLDSRMGTVDYGIRLCSLMDSAEFVRENIPPRQRFGHEELLEETAAYLPEEGICLGIGQERSRWMLELADRVGRPFHAFGAARTADARAAQNTESESTELSGENMMFHEGLIADTIPACLEQHQRSIAFVALDGRYDAQLPDTLHSLANRLVVGTVLMFHEGTDLVSETTASRTAVIEFCSTSGIDFDYIGVATDRDACVVAIQITGMLPVN